MGMRTPPASSSTSRKAGPVTGPPLNLGEDQIGQAVDQVINSVQSNAQNIAGYALTGVGAVGSGLLNLVLALVLAFFFIKDGPRWLPWLAAQTGPKVAPHVAALSYKTWSTLSEFIRQQALVGFIDAFFIEDGEIVLVDYKSDHVREAETLIGRYQKQLELYAEALEKITGLRVKEKLIYSIILEQAIPV